MIDEPLFHLFIILIILFGIIIPNNDKENRLIYIIITFLGFLVYILFGDYINNGDTLGYCFKFVNNLNLSFNEMLNSYNGVSKSPTFYLCGYIFGKIIPFPEYWIYFIVIFYIFCVSLLIYTDSKNPYISYLLFIILGSFTFCLSGLRQTFAMAFILISYYMLKKKKLLLFVLFVWIASLFHLSAIVFLIIYPIAYKKLSWIHLIVSIFVLFVFFVEQSIFRNLIKIVFQEQYLAGYADATNGLNYTLFIIQFMLFVLYLVFYKNTIKNEPKSIILYNMCLCGVVFQLFSTVVAETFRVSYYFSFFNVLLLPTVLNNISNNNKSIKFVNISVSLLFIVFIIFKYILQTF